MSWTQGKDRLLAEYWLSPAGFWPRDPYVAALRVLDRRGRVLTQWMDPGPPGRPMRVYWPAGRSFVGIRPYGARQPVLVRKRSVTALRWVRGLHPAGQGDVRFGHGWLLNVPKGTVTRERIPGCRRASIRIDLRDRIWCLAPGKTLVRWSDDGGLTWASHTLSTSYFEYCDGGALGRELEILGDVVAIGMWRADFSADRGATWQSVSLPFGMVGARRELPSAIEDCTQANPLRDGRLVIGYSHTAVAEDSTNTRFRLVRTPRRTTLVGVREGVLLAASRRPNGSLLVSYDGARTWQPLRVRALVRHVLGDH